MTEFETFPDPFLSIYQSAVSETGRRLDKKRPSSRGMMAERGGLEHSSARRSRDLGIEIARREAGLAPEAATKDQTLERELSGGDRLRVCAEAALRYMKARVTGDTAMLVQLRNEFKKGDCDPLWIETVEEHLKYYGTDGTRHAVPYRRAADVGPHVIPIKSTARIALIGDWGTGEPPALSVLREIAGLRPDVVIHLGDIYYSGTAAECQLNFRSMFDAVLRKGNPELPIFTLSGNHDMYSGGVAYYALIDKLNPAATRQTASFFCLRTTDDAWQFLAMDTGLHDNDPKNVANAVTYLEEDELAWHCDRMHEFGGKTVLLSHHQLFSAFSAIGPKRQDGGRSAVNPRLLNAYEKISSHGSVAAWFWGHEHTCSVYKPFSKLERGRCLGHGAVPVSLGDDIYKTVEKLDDTPELLDETRLRSQGNVYAHGFALLEVKAGSIKASYYQDVGGTAIEMFAEVIS